MNSDEVVELFDGGWLQLDAGLPQTRVIVARHHVPAPGKRVSVGKCIGEWVYELFITTLPADGFLAEEVLDLYHGRGADRGRCSLTKTSKKIPTAGAPTRSVGRNCGKWPVNGCGTCGSRLGKRCKETRHASSNGHPPRPLLPSLCRMKAQFRSMDRGLKQQHLDVLQGCSRADSFVLQEDGTLCCPAGATLWLSEVRQENAFTQRAVYVASQMDCPHCPLRERCLGCNAKGNRARRISAVRRLLPSPSSVKRDPHLLQAIRWVGVAGRALRRTWTAHWREQYVEVLPVAQAQQETKPPPRPPRALRSHRRWSWHDRLARNAWWGPPQLRITEAFVPTFLASK